MYRGWLLASAFRAFISGGRAHHAIAVVAAILVGFGLKLIFFSAPIAEADARSIESVRMDVSDMHRNVQNLLVEKAHDMTFVYSDGD